MALSGIQSLHSVFLEEMIRCEIEKNPDSIVLNLPLFLLFSLRYDISPLTLAQCWIHAVLLTGLWASESLCRLLSLHYCPVSHPVRSLYASLHFLAGQLSGLQPPDMHNPLASPSKLAPRAGHLARASLGRPQAAAAPEMEERKEEGEHGRGGTKARHSGIIMCSAQTARKKQSPHSVLAEAAELQKYQLMLGRVQLLKCHKGSFHLV